MGETLPKDSALPIFSEPMQVIGTLIDTTYGAYARVMTELGEATSWLEAAHAAAVEFHPAISWDSIASSLPPQRDRLAPRQGSLGGSVALSLARALVGSDNLARTVEFEVWVGYGGLRIPGEASRRIVAPLAREMICYTGLLATVGSIEQIERVVESTSIETYPIDRDLPFPVGDL